MSQKNSFVVVMARSSGSNAYASFEFADLAKPVDRLDSTRLLADITSETIDPMLALYPSGVFIVSGREDEAYTRAIAQLSGAWPVVVHSTDGLKVWREKVESPYQGDIYQLVNSLMATVQP